MAGVRARCVVGCKRTQIARDLAAGTPAPFFQRIAARLQRIELYRLSAPCPRARVILRGPVDQRPPVGRKITQMHMPLHPLADREAVVLQIPGYEAVVRFRAAPQQHSLVRLCGEQNGEACAKRQICHGTLNDLSA